MRLTLNRDRGINYQQAAQILLAFSFFGRPAVSEPVDDTVQQSSYTKEITALQKLDDPSDRLVALSILSDKVLENYKGSFLVLQDNKAAAAYSNQEAMAALRFSASMSAANYAYGKEKDDFMVGTLTRHTLDEAYKSINTLIERFYDAKLIPVDLTATARRIIKENGTIDNDELKKYVAENFSHFYSEVVTQSPQNKNVDPDQKFVLQHAQRLSNLVSLAQLLYSTSASCGQYLKAIRFDDVSIPVVLNSFVERLANSRPTW